MSKAASATGDDADLAADLPRKKWSGKKIVLIAAPILLLAIGGGVAAALGVIPGMGGKDDAATKEAAAAAADQTITYVDMPDMMVNLNTGQGRQRFLKLSVKLEVKGPEAAKAIEAQLPRIRDNFQIYLRELRVEDLGGSAGVFLLKEELLRRVNTEIAPARVEDVLFSEILMQ
jgi:flagellar FliL protein